MIPSHFRLLVAFFLLSFVACQNTVEEIPPSNQQLLQELVADFQGQTGIAIFYEPGDSELQTQLEIDHAVSDGDYSDATYFELLNQVEKLIAQINSFPIEFVEDLKIDGILIIDRNQPLWSGRAAKQMYYSVAFDGLIYLDNSTLIAHELFHIYDPGLPLIVPGSSYETSWSELNPPGFGYGDGCVVVSGLNSNYSEGFLNDYARCTAAEDRAIVFSFLFSKNDELQQFRDIDAYLDAKASFIEDLLDHFAFDF